MIWNYQDGKFILWPFKKLEILCYMVNHRTNIIDLSFIYVYLIINEKVVKSE